jgi:hypothetical protein
MEGVDEKRKRDRSRDFSCVRVAYSFWPELDGLYVPHGETSWDGLPQWNQLTADEEAKGWEDYRNKKGSGGNGIWWRNEGHWRMGRRNHYFYISDTVSDFPPATDEGAVWESAEGFYTRKGNSQAADKLCQSGHPDGINTTVTVTWEYR